MTTSCRGTRAEKQPDGLLRFPLEEEPFVDNDSTCVTTDHDDLFDKIFLNDDVMLSWLRDTDANDVNVDDMLNMLVQGAPIGEGFSEASKTQKSTSQDNQILLPLASCDDPGRLASFLQARFTAFANLDKQSIIELLEKGAKTGLQPKISYCNIHEIQIPPDLTKRNGKKRGPYKMTKKDSWTSTRESGESGSAVLNALHSKRSPPANFKQRFLNIHHVDMNECSMGVAEVSW